MKSLFLLSVMLFSFNSSAKNCTLIQNNKGLSIPTMSSTGISKDQFENVLKEFTGIYSPIVSQYGYKLVMNDKWEAATINSDTFVSGNSWIIDAYGGLARYMSMTPAGYMLVLCHEIGHHLGGYPRVSGWASNEGQSDYYSAMKCFSRTSYSRSFKTRINSVGSECQLQHNGSAINVCINTANAGYVLANVLRDLANSPNSVSFDTPDRTQVEVTDDSHPNAQCRLDTYFAGSTCGVSKDVPFSSNDPKPGACSKENGDSVGVRPLCWYKPKF